MARLGVLSYTTPDRQLCTEPRYIAVWSAEYRSTIHSTNDQSYHFIRLLSYYAFIGYLKSLLAFPYQWLLNFPKQYTIIMR